MLIPSACSPLLTAALTLLLGVGLLAGCGSPEPYLPPLEGVMHWEDGTEPRELEGATVEFESDGNVAARTVLIGDGTFMLDKPLPPGTYRIRIQPLPTADRALHPRFKSFDASGLTYTSAADQPPQTVNFKIARSG
jgi:hypothetical protein